MQRPPARFAWNGDVSLAYQVCGEGPTELVFHDRGARMLKGAPGEWRVYTVGRSRAGEGS
jgi:hypothetical protein